MARAAQLSFATYRVQDACQGMAQRAGLPTSITAVKSSPAHSMASQVIPDCVMVTINIHQNSNFEHTNRRQTSTPLILALGSQRQRQANFCEFKVSLIYK